MHLIWSIAASIAFTALAAEGCVARELVAARGGATVNLETIEQAFGSYASGEAARQSPACPRSGAAHGSSPGDGELRPSILGFAFDCAEGRGEADTQGERLAAAFRAVVETRDATTDDPTTSFGWTADRREAAFGHFIDASQLPAPVATREVDEEPVQLRDAPIEEASWPGADRAAEPASPELAEVAEAGAPDAVRSEDEAGLEVVAFDGSDQSYSTAEDEADPGVVGSIGPDALPARAVETGRERPKGAGSPKVSIASRLAVTRPQAPRREVRNVSVSRTVRTPGLAARLAASPQRIDRRGMPPEVESAPALAQPRARARSFSPKMSSAGPAQTAPSLQR